MSASIKAARASVRGRSTPGVPRGDPGVFSGLLSTFKAGFKGLGGLKGIATSVLGGVLGTPGTPQVLPPPVGIAGLPTLPPPISISTIVGPQQIPQPQVVTRTPGVRGAIERFLPGGATGLELRTTQAQVAQGMTPKGFHLNKSDYFLKNGTFIAKGSVFVKNRRRNPLNPRALRNAIGRVDAGKIWQGKLNEITTGKFTSAGNRKAC